VREGRGFPPYLIIPLPFGLIISTASRFGFSDHDTLVPGFCYIFDGGLNMLASIEDEESVLTQKIIEDLGRLPKRQESDDASS
jgi:hypothetical protein